MVGIAGLGCSTTAAKVSFVEFISGLMAIGLDSGEGVVSLLLASDDPRAGILTTFASFLAMGVASCAVVVVGTENSNRLDFAEFSQPSHSTHTIYA